MIEYEVTNDDIRIITQKNQNIYAKVQLLSKSTMRTLAEIGGIVTDGSITIDAQSIARKSANLTMYITDDFVGIGKNKMIWFDKYLRLYIGLKDNKTDAIKYYCMGLFVFDPITFNYSAIANSLTLSLADLMSQFSAEKDGIIGGYNKFVIPAFKQDENGNPTDIPNTIREALIELITTYGGIKSYIIEDIGTYATKDTSIPYDLEFDVGTSILDVITKLRDLYPGYEVFFDNDGTFICRQKAIENNDPIYIDFEEFQRYITSDGETVNVDINAIKNVIEVWGQDIYYDRYTEFCNETNSVTLTSGGYTIPQEDIDEINNNPFCYHVICEDTEEPLEGTYYAIKVSSDNYYGQTIKIQVNTDEEHYFKNLTAYPIWDEYTDDYIEANKLKTGNMYVFLFKNEKFYYYGSFTAHGVAVLSSSTLSDEIKQNFYNRFQTDNISFIVNTSTQLGVDQIGIRLAESSSETCSNIDSDSLALSQAEYEIYENSRFSDTISLNTILIPWLNVNTKVQYKSHNDIFGLDLLSDKEKEQKLTYLVNKVDIDIKNFTMSVELTHFYSLYQEKEESKYYIDSESYLHFSNDGNYVGACYVHVNNNLADYYPNGITDTKFKVDTVNNKLWAGYVYGNVSYCSANEPYGDKFTYLAIAIASCETQWTKDDIKSLVYSANPFNALVSIENYDTDKDWLIYQNNYFCVEQEDNIQHISGIPIFNNFEDVKEYWITGNSSKCINNF